MRSSVKPILIKPEDGRIKTGRKVLGLSLPVIVGNMLYAVENTVSVFLVSGLSTSAIAAVGFSTSMLWFVYSLMSLAYHGTVVLVAQRVGARKDPSPAFLWGVFLAILIGLPLTFFGTDLVSLLMFLLGASESVVSLAREYLKPIFSVIILMFVSEVFYGAYNASGDTKTPFKVGLLYTSTHILLAYLLIYGELGFPRLDVLGAGLGLAVAEVVGFLAYLFLYLAKKKPFSVNFKPDVKLLKDFLRIGTPTAIDRAFSSFSFNVFVGFFAKFGDKVLASYQIGLRIEILFFMVSMSMMIATTTIVGQNYGAKNYRGLEYCVRIIAHMSAFIMGAGGLVMLFFPSQLASIFTKDLEVIKYAVYYLVIVALSQPQLAYASIYSGALKGMGKTHIPLLVNSLSFWSFRIIPSYGLLMLFHSPLVPWIMMSVETTLRAIIFYWAYKGEIKRLKD